MTPPRSLIGFGITGLCATALHILVAATLTETFAQSPVLANGVAFCAAQAAAWLSFRSRISMVSIRLPMLIGATTTPLRGITSTRPSTVSRSMA